MRYFKNLHPICIFTYFVVVIVLVLLCQNPVVMITACAGALFFLVRMDGWKKAIGWLKMLLPMVLFITIANPLFSHKGITRLFLFGGQWITLEAVCYGITSGLSLAALILWFACYQKVMTSEKFLYLFGKIAPATTLLISMALNLVPKLQGQLKQIQDSQEMLRPALKGRLQKLKTAMRHVSTLLGWSLENTVEQADSMKARGYGIRKRTTFHLFRFESRDGAFLGVLILVAGMCGAARISGCGTMTFYPRMSALVSGTKDYVFYLLFLVLVCIPGILEWKEDLLWRFYDLNR